MTTPGRRRIIDPQPEADTEGRRGCLTAGAILGIIAGVILGFVVLPRVLDAFLAGEEIAAGESYIGDAREIGVLSVVTGIDVVVLDDGGTAPGTVVTLDVTSRKTWEIEPAFFQLELSSGGDWIEAAEPVESLPETSIEFELGESRPLLLQFEHPMNSGEPVYLHLSDPSIRLELPPAE